MENYIQFMAQHRQNYVSYQKKLQLKIVRDWISHKKVTGRLCLSSTSVEPGASKDWHIRSIILYEKCSQKYTSHQKKLKIFRPLQLHSRGR